MPYIQGEGHSQGTLFPAMLYDLIPIDHMCRVVECLRWATQHGAAWLRSEPADTGRPGYDPRALLKLYLYGYLNQIRSGD
jgi:transposase